MEKSSLTEALAKVQAALPKIDKGNTATIPGKYSYDYADLADVSEQILPLLAENGLAWICKPTLLNGQFVLNYKMRHVAGEVEEGDYPLGAPNGRPQDQGSAITYARRYALCSVVGVVPDKDDDGEGAGQQYERNQQTPAQQTGGQRPRGASAAGRQSGSGSSNSSNGTNLQTFMLTELKGPQRPAFTTWFAKNLPQEQLTSVSAAVQATVESAINSFACGQVPADLDEPF